MPRGLVLPLDTMPWRNLKKSVKKFLLSVELSNCLYYLLTAAEEDCHVQSKRTAINNSYYFLVLSTTAYRSYLARVVILLLANVILMGNDFLSSRKFDGECMYVCTCICMPKHII